MTIFRLIAVLWPLKASRLCNGTRVNGAIVAVYLAAFIVNIPHFLYTK